MPPIFFLRGGGLGDFLLTLPLLKEAHFRDHQVCLYARSNYLQLLDHDWKWLEKYDLDALGGRIPPLSEGSQVIAFWHDDEWQRQLEQAGASRISTLDPCPSKGDHFARQGFDYLGWNPFPKWKKQAYLGEKWRNEDQGLWIHPGSGSRKKNLPFEYFQLRALEWLSSRDDRRVVFSFGEADDHLYRQWEQSDISKDSRTQSIQPSSVLELCEKMTEQADQFLGNDSGPGHLAANLGIPTEICFCATPVSIWEPTGPRVITYNWDSDSSRIL